MEAGRGVAVKCDNCHLEWVDSALDTHDASCCIVSYIVRIERERDNLRMDNAAVQKRINELERQLVAK